MHGFLSLVYKTHKGATFQAFTPLLLCNLPCQQASNWTIISGKTQDTPNKESTEIRCCRTVKPNMFHCLSTFLI